jgi:hypothetical protein
MKTHWSFSPLRIGKGDADLLRADACAGILSENEFRKERVCLTDR